MLLQTSNPFCLIGSYFIVQIINISYEDIRFTINFPYEDYVLLTILLRFQNTGVILVSLPSQNTKTRVQAD